MKRFAVLATILFLVLSPSQAKTNVAEKDSVSRAHSPLKNQTQTKSVLAVAVPKHQRRFTTAVDLTDPEDDDLPGPDELDLQVPYRRPSLVQNPVDVDEPLSDYVSVRLAVARARALERYRQTYL